MAALRLAIQGRARFAALPAPSTLRRWVAAAVDRGAEITLRFVGGAEGRRLNRDFRGRDHATNVLTFAYALEPVVVADVVLCVPVVRREAREQGKTAREHLAHLIVHGVLHARGFDHDTASRAKAMEAREIDILARFGIADPYRPLPPG